MQSVPPTTNGAIHRDLKLDNSMVDGEGRLKILDFGLLKLKQESAAFQWIAFWAKTQDGGPQRVRRSGEDAIPLPVSGGTTYRWSADSKSVYYTADGELWVASVEQGRERRLTDLADKPGNPGPYSIDADREYLYFTWRDDVGDIWVMDVAQE